MSQASEQDPKNESNYFKDHLVVRHSDGRSERFSLPEDVGTVTRIGRELDNDLVLTDARASRYHATIRRTSDGLEIKDLNSANGTTIGTRRLDPDTWERMFRMNALTAVTMCKTCVPNLVSQPGAAIINIGAAAAARADAGMGAYAASKAAVARLTESLAAELACEDISVNAVLPTIIDTPTNRADMPDADTSGWVRVVDIAKVIAFLASDAARSISGESIRVSRGSGD